MVLTPSTSKMGLQHHSVSQQLPLMVLQFPQMVLQLPSMVLQLPLVILQSDGYKNYSDVPILSFNCHTTSSDGLKSSSFGTASHPSSHSTHHNGSTTSSDGPSTYHTDPLTSSDCPFLAQGPAKSPDAHTTFINDPKTFSLMIQILPMMDLQLSEVV